MELGVPEIAWCGGARSRDSLVEVGFQSAGSRDSLVEAGVPETASVTNTARNVEVPKTKSTCPKRNTLAKRALASRFLFPAAAW